MEFYKKLPFVHFVILTSSLLVGLSADVWGQGRTSQRLDQKLDGRSTGFSGQRASSSKKGLDISLVTSLAYDDNIFRISENETGSVVARLEPTIGWTAGSKDGSWVRLAYQGAAVVFLSSQEDNRIDNRVLVEGGVKGKSLALAYSARWARLGNPSADLGGESDRFEWGGEVGVTYTPKGKLSYRAFAEKTVVDQIEPAFFDFFQSSGGLAVNYRYSSKTELEAAYRLGQAEVDGSGRQTFHRLSLRTLWRPRSKVSLSFEGGVERRNNEGSSRTNPYLAARIDWRPRVKTAFYLEAYRREVASAALEGENFSLLGVRAGVTQRLKGGWSAGLEVGRERADYFGIAGLPESNRDDLITFIRPSVSYAFGDVSELVLFYQYSQNESTDARFGFDNQQLGVSMNYRF